MKEAIFALNNQVGGRRKSKKREFVKEMEKELFFYNCALHLICLNSFTIELRRSITDHKIFLNLEKSNFKHITESSKFETDVNISWFFFPPCTKHDWVKISTLPL